MEDFVHVPKDLKRFVIGAKGSIIKSIEERSGARVSSLSRDEEGFRVSGTREERDLAKELILEKVEGGKLKLEQNKSNKTCFFIDDFNLPVNAMLRLEKDYGTSLQYRLRPFHSCGTEESPSLANDPIYLKTLEAEVLHSLERIKHDIKTKRHLKADIWCHFGAVLIRQPDEGPGGEWSTENALGKLLAGTEWKTSFRGGVNLDEKFVEQHLCNQSLPEYEDYQSRYDLTFRTPIEGQLTLKVWVIKKNVRKTLKSIEIPFTDLKNILDEVCFEDPFTSSRCRGWLILPPQRYLRADILFPGCEFDCRLTIRALADSGFNLDFVPKEDIRHALLRYLSKVTFSDEDDFGLRLPNEKLPDGFQLSFMRCSKRAVYRFSEEFSIILSKERTTTHLDGSDFKKETDFHLHCKEWDELLKRGNWEPAEITKKLPDFFGFVKKVQSSIIHEMKHEGASVPPEILARGSSAVESYFKAVTDGTTSLKRVPIMLIGQDRAGKTSLKKSLKGICFDPKEGSTVGIDVDPSYFKVTTDAFRTGTGAEQQDADGDISFDRHAVMKTVHDLRKGNESPLSKTSREETKTPSDDECEGAGITDTIQPKRHTEHGETREQAPAPTKDAPDLSPFLSGVNQEARTDFTRTLPEETVVEIETLLKGDNREHLFLTLWDFAGQSVYYDTHQIFLTEQAIYCLVYDLSLKPHEEAKPIVKEGVYEERQDNLKTNIDYLDFWMWSVASVAGDSPNSSDRTAAEDEMFPQKLPPVFLVCTHADKAYENRNPEKIAREILGCLKRKPYGIHLSNVFVVDNTKSGTESECPGVVSLRKKLYDVAERLPYISETIPIKWLTFDKALRALKEEGTHFVFLETAKDIAKSCDIVDDVEFETVMNYLHDLRILIHFDNTAALKEFVVLDVQWLIDVFKNVITVKPYDNEEKKFDHLWSKLEKGILHEELLSHVWGTLSEKEGLYEGLITIMEKFSLLCPLSSERSKTYLVPSMLKIRRPSRKIVEFISSAQIPSVFVKFKSGKVPGGLFHRFVIQFFRWGRGNFLRVEEPKLTQNVVRFNTCGDKFCSVIFVCHTSTVEVAIYAQDKQKATACICASVVCRQLRLMLESMREEFFWLRKMRYELAVLCPVCCRGGALEDYCDTHDLEGCKEEHCLHFWSLSELCSAEKPIVCNKAGLEIDVVVDVKQFSPWLPPSEQQDPSFPSTSSSASQEGHESRSGQAPSRKLKVTLLSSEWQSTKGGLSTINRELAIQLAKHHNVEVSMYLPRCSEDDVKIAEGYHVKLVQARKSIGCKPIGWLSNAPENHEIDYVIGHGLILGQQVQLIQRNKKCKWVQVVHTAPEDLGKFKSYANAVSRAEEKHKAEIELCELADEVVAVGPKLADAYSRYLRYCQRDLSVFELTPGIFSEFSLVKQAVEERRTFCVLVFGRGDTEDFELKGYDIAAKAIYELDEASYELIFVGASLGKEEEAAEKLCEHGIARKQLTVRSFKESREELVKLFCEVDLCIMPSRTEGFGLAGLEALSAGLPILVSGNSGLGDALQNVPHGSSCVVNSEDPKEWAKAIKIVRKKKRDVRLEETEDLRTQYARKYCWKEQCDELVKKMSDSIFGN